MVKCSKKVRVYLSEMTNKWSGKMFNKKYNAISTTSKSEVRKVYPKYWNTFLYTSTAILVTVESFVPRYCLIFQGVESSHLIDKTAKTNPTTAIERLVLPTGANPSSRPRNLDTVEFSTCVCDKVIVSNFSGYQIYFRKNFGKLFSILT